MKSSSKRRTYNAVPKQNAIIGARLANPRECERSVVIFVETERGCRRDEEPYSYNSYTVTIPDGGIAKGSAKSTALLRRVLAHLFTLTLALKHALPPTPVQPR